jgi:DNA-binding GntR family transcriptional regulator
VKESDPAAAQGRSASRAATGDGTSRVHRAYEALRRRILDNELPAGTQLLEGEIAALLQMSRTPVREAMLQLAYEGLVEVRPRHGMRVLPVSAADMAEIYQILRSLESTAAELLAQRGLSAAELELMEQAVADMSVALQADDLAAWAAADERFHRLLVDLCGNQRLRGVANTFFEQSHRARMITLRLRPKPVESNRDHAALVEAIRRRDPKAAREIHDQHRARNAEVLLKLLRHYGLTQL